MLRRLSARHQSWPLAAPFRISRGVKHSAEVVVVKIRQGALSGRGEGVPYARYGESIDSVLMQVRAVAGLVEAGATRGDLARALPPGAARSAIDAALWDLEAAASGEAVSTALGHGPPQPLTTALTVGLDTPERMAEAARSLAGAALVKIKVDASRPEAQIRAVRRHCPDARLIVDPNESWNIDLLRTLQPVLAEARVDLVEQPLPAADDAALAGLGPAVPMCADESCHVGDDLPRLRGLYQAVNIKLDKTGGLTEALRLLAAARADGFRIMVGCMICSSLGIAPALQVAREAEFVDLDGPLWLQRDHAGGARTRAGLLSPPEPGFWGEPVPLALRGAR
ncbi:N-acetyl-D-Glu racemase DgcA [Luteimonas salinilitoris]|uniref:Dipeptide epimerase n=1 Tax=Luteimonas salinilitoris TaxID=3237697 RepID=A0ABV4HUE3_9GAMM